MEEKIESLIDALVKKREGLLEKYVAKLEDYACTEAGPQPQGMDAITMSGLVIDLDRHITNLNLELKRLKTSNQKTKEAVHA